MLLSVSTTSSERKSIGPALPPGFIKQERSNVVEDGEDLQIGPSVSDMSKGDDASNNAAQAFEKRSQKMKERLTVKVIS